MKNYIGNAKEKILDGEDGKYKILECSIQVSKATPHFKKMKSGELYLFFDIVRMKQQDKYGNDYSLSVWTADDQNITPTNTQENNGFDDSEIPF